MYTIFGYLIPLLAIVQFAFIIWMVIDCVRQQNPLIWILVMFFFPPASLVYFVIYKLPDLQLASWWQRKVAGGRRIRQLKAEIFHRDLPYHWSCLGDEYRRRRNWPEAARCYAEALRRDPQTEEASYGMGLVAVEEGKFDEALQRLEPLVQANPRYDYGNAQLGIARAWRGLGRMDQAAACYEKLLSHYTYSEVRFEYAELLHAMGRKEEAEQRMQRIIDEAHVQSGFARVRELKWARRARLFLFRH